MSELNKILIADDNSINRQVLGRLLNKLGYESDAVINGEEAFHAVVDNKYHIVFMDIHMPVMGGIESTQKIKIEFGSNSPVIIALTADSFVGDEQELISAGMDDYLPKPINKENLENILNKWLKK
ncbi:MAG: response regulator [Ignavibacteriaceae bacterium]|jgi:CheY-like chemotaxis protein|nr:response regulator [Ignavibacteriaceae bacterium]